MFFLRELYYQLGRKKARTVLILCLAVLLNGCVALYLCNIYANEALLANVGEAAPVRFQVVSGDGSRESGLNINTRRVDILRAAPVKDIMCNAVAAGAYSEEARAEDPFTGGDASIAGGNCLEATGVPARGCEFADGVDASIFEGKDAVCVVDSMYADNWGLAIGDEVTLPAYMAQWDDNGIRYNSIGELSMEIVGILSHQYAGPSMTAIFVPVDFLRQAVEDRGLGFFYASFSASVANPMELNAFKENLREMGFRDTTEPSPDLYSGDTVIVDDEMFIDTVTTLRGNLRTFRAFEVPFFVLILCLVTLSTFLIMRGDKMEIALQRSLGQPRLRIGLVRLATILLVDILGCAVAYALFLYAAGIEQAVALTVCGAYLATTVVGSIIAVANILRADALTSLAGS